MKYSVVIFFFFLSSCFAQEVMRGTYIKEPIFNASVYMEISGDPSREAIVLVHGLGDEASTIWEKSITLLEKEYFVISFDLPGFGRSSKANELYSPLNYAKFIHYIAQTYVKKPFHLVGHSMGGAIALKYTQMYKDDVVSLALIDAAGILHRYAYSKYLATSGIDRFFDEQNGLIQGIQTPKFNHFIDKITEKIDNKMTLDMDVVLSSEDLRGIVLGGSPSSVAAVALVQENFNGVPQKIDTRTTLIWGEDDGIAPLQTGYTLHKLMPNSALNIIPKAGHVPMISHEKEFFKLLMAHLNHHETYIKKKIDQSKEAYNINLKNAKDKVFSGNIGSISVRDSQKIVIKDAFIEELLVTNSDVEVINSTLKNSDEVIIIAQNSTLSIIGSDLFGRMKLNNSRLNLMGITMLSQSKPIEATARSIVIFSLCTINDKLIHGREVFER